MNSRDFRNTINTLISQKNKEWIVFGDAHVADELLSFADLDFLINTIKYSQPEQLGLANLNLNDELTAYLVSGLRSNNSIKCLYLPFNKITDKGAAEIADLLLVSAIKKIYLFNNKIGDEGMTLLASSLLINQNINTAELFNNPFTQKAVHGLKLAAQMNPNIKTLLLYPGDGGIVLEEQLVTEEKRRAFFMNYQRRIKHQKMLGTISKMRLR